MYTAKNYPSNVMTFLFLVISLITLSHTGHAQDTLTIVQPGTDKPITTCVTHVGGVIVCH